MSQDIDS